MPTKRYIVKGIVQGVSFRAYTCQEARALGVEGWVRNNSDGSVTVCASAAAETLAKLETWLRHGPPAARVDSVDSEDIEDLRPEKLTGFNILY